MWVSYSLDLENPKLRPVNSLSRERMSAIINFHEIEDFSERFGGQAEDPDGSFFTIGDDHVPIMEEDDIVWLRGYTLDVLQSRFAALYVSERGYSLAWPGRIEFAHLEEEALCSLPWHLTAGKLKPKLNDPKILSAAVVSFIIKGEHDELVKYRLSVPEEFRKTRKVLASPETICFARYDFTFAPNALDWATPKLRFYFTAENPLFSNGNGCELAIKQPRTQYCSEHLVKWIVDHHDKKQAVEGIDVGECVALIERLLVDPQDSP